MTTTVDILAVLRRELSDIDYAIWVRNADLAKLYERRTRLITQIQRMERDDCNNDDNGTTTD